MAVLLGVVAVVEIIVWRQQRAAARPSPEPVPSASSQAGSVASNPHAGHGLGAGTNGEKSMGMMDHSAMGHGPGGMQMGMGGDMGDMQDIRQLLMSHKQIVRSVKVLTNGVETLTTSTNPAVAARIQGHVKAMHERLHKKQVIRPMDPIFVAIFENADKIDLLVTNLPDGVKAVETSNDAYVVKLIQTHARVVDRFVKEGMQAMMKTTEVPPREPAARETPK